jgi:hypothetical protein
MPRWPRPGARSAAGCRGAQHLAEVVGEAVVVVNHHDRPLLRGGAARSDAPGRVRPPCCWRDERPPRACGARRRSARISWPSARAAPAPGWCGPAQLPLRTCCSEATAAAVPLGAEPHLAGVAASPARQVRLNVCGLLRSDARAGQRVGQRLGASGHCSGARGARAMQALARCARGAPPSSIKGKRARERGEGGQIIAGQLTRPAITRRRAARALPNWCRAAACCCRPCPCRPPTPAPAR